MDHAHFDPPAKYSLPLTTDCRPSPSTPAWIFCHGGVTTIFLNSHARFSADILSCLMYDLAMQEGTGAAAAPRSWSQGPEALPPGDSSSPSPGVDVLTPESSSGNSSNEDFGREEQGLAMDPLLSSSNNDSSDDDEGYELRQRESRGVDGAGGRLRHGFTYSAEEERAVVDKFDRRLVLFVAFLYMLSFLDRSSLSTLSLSPCLLFPCALSGQVWLVPESQFWFLRPAPKKRPPSSSNLFRWGPEV